MSSLNSNAEPTEEELAAIDDELNSQTGFRCPYEYNPAWPACELCDGELRYCTSKRKTPETAKTTAHTKHDYGDLWSPKKWQTPEPKTYQYGSPGTPYSNTTYYAPAPKEPAMVWDIVLANVLCESLQEWLKSYEKNEFKGDHPEHSIVRGLIEKYRRWERQSFQNLKNGEVSFWLHDVATIAEMLND